MPTFIYPRGVLHLDYLKTYQEFADEVPPSAFVRPVGSTSRKKPALLFQVLPIDVFRFIYEEPEEFEEWWATFSPKKKDSMIHRMATKFLSGGTGDGMGGFGWNVYYFRWDKRWYEVVNME